jgi:hypothetical protein
MTPVGQTAGQVRKISAVSGVRLSDIFEVQDRDFQKADRGQILVLFINPEL